jgi:outer membrane cobalamin receptor
MRKTSTLFLLLLLLLGSAGVYGQITVSGTLLDQETSEPLIGATVVVEGTTIGSTTSIDGEFSFQVSESPVTLLFSYVGYANKSQRFNVADRGALGIIYLESNAISLGEIAVTASIGVARRTPVAMSNITPQFIEEKLGTMEFPEILKSTPGVYATKGPGGFGDSKINMRGFQSANVAVMINGVPMNDMEWGGVYWSNWAGLSDVTSLMQTQRGLGASKVSAPSVGGSINIITKSIDAKKGGSASYSVGNDGYNKVVFDVSTGLSETGWAMTMLLGKTWGDGYVQGADFEGYNYFINVAKKINDEHQISFTAFGAPQEHYQRSRYDGLTIQGWQEVQKYMGDDSPYKYNPTYGFGLNGERKSSAYNVYHKPQISLNHLWQIDEKSSLSTSLYTSLGRGYGYSGQNHSDYSGHWYGTTNGVLNETYRNPDGTFAYDQIYEVNAESEDGSVLAMSKSKNFHDWYGILSTYTTTVAQIIDVYGGIDTRYYKGVHTNELVDLYGGDYYIDRYRNNVLAENFAGAGTEAFRMKKLQVGDVVYRDYDGHVFQAGGFGQAEYNVGSLSAFVSGSLSNTTYWRYDRFYYDADNAKSNHIDFWGYTVKGGANYNLTSEHNVFANIGYISRAPFFSGGAFLNSTVSNETNPNAVNEKIFSIEAGYGFKSSWLKADVNVYRTLWMDKLLSRSVDYDDGSRGSINMEGIDALHQGVEIELVAKPYSWLDITGMLSIGDWQWNNNTVGYFYNDGSQPIRNKNGDIASGDKAPDHANTKLTLEGIEVGGSAQTTAALGAKFKINKDLRTGIDFYYFGRNFADWNFNSNDLEIGGNKVYTTPWEMPEAGIFDFFASYAFPLGGTKAVISGNVNNVLDQEYIADAVDGGTGQWQNAYQLFYGFGRTYNVRLKINF